MARSHKKNRYWGAKAFDASCRSNGGCPYCAEGRYHKHDRDISTLEVEMDENEKYIGDSNLVERLNLNLRVVQETISTSHSLSQRAGQTVVNILFPVDVKCPELFYCSDDTVMDVIVKYVNLTV